MSEVQARLAPLRGLDPNVDRFSSQEKEPTPVILDANLGMDMSASENAFIRQTFSHENLARCQDKSGSKDFSTSGSKDFSTSSD
jgi:hypothetical protein